MSAVQTEAERLPWTDQDAVVRERAVPAARPVAVPRARPRARAGAGLRRGLLAIGLAAGMAAGAVASSVAVAQQAFAVDSARVQIQLLQGQDRQLQAQLAQLQSPQRIESVAIDQLGLQRPAGYSPVSALPVPPAPTEGAATSAQAALPVPAGPAPGSASAVLRSMVRGASAAWRRIRG